MKRRIVTVVAVAMMCGALVVSATPGKLVLKGGQAVEVASARIAGGMVYVTLPGGEMRAYALGDVDLEASGLAPKAKEEAGAPANPRPKALAELARKDRKATRVTITDADVEHVRPAVPGEEEGEASGDKAAASAKGKLVVDVKDYRRKGNKVSLQGTVTNQGSFPVSGVVLRAEAKDSKGKVVGSAEKNLGGTIEPNGSAGFSITVAVTTDDVRGAEVHVVGATTAASVERPEGAAPAGGESPEGGE